MFTYSSFFEMLASDRKYALALVVGVVVVYWIYSIVMVRLCRRRGLDICASGFVVGYNLLLLPKLLLTMFFQRPRKPRKPKVKAKKKKADNSKEISETVKENS